MLFKFGCKNLTMCYGLGVRTLCFLSWQKKTKQNMAKKQNKMRWSTCTDMSLHVRTTVETLETICIIYLDSNKRRHVSVCTAQLLLQASPSPTPTKNHNKIGFPSKTGPDPWNKITKLPRQPSMLGHHRHASAMPYIWRIASGLMMPRL